MGSYFQMLKLKAKYLEVQQKEIQQELV